jgi:flagellar hook-associated protein 2
LNHTLTGYTSSSDGAFTVDLSSISTEESGLQTDVTNFQTNVIAPLKTQLNAEYSSAEEALQQLPREMQGINELLGINGSSSSSGG